MAGLHSGSPAWRVSDLDTRPLGPGLQVRTDRGADGRTGHSPLGRAPRKAGDLRCLGHSENFIDGVQSQASWPVAVFRRGTATVG